MKRIHFIPECYADTLFVETLFFEGEFVYHEDSFQHASGTPWVARGLKENMPFEQICIGFVDDDKKHKPNYFNEFGLLDQHPNVQFRKHFGSNRYLMVVSPAIEKFLLTQLVQIGRQPSDYGLSNDFIAFRDQLKKRTLIENKEYKLLVTDLKEKSPSGIAFILEKIASLR